jgi:hypothetical protein
MYTPPRLTSDEEFAFEQQVLKSIRSRYEAGLEWVECPHTGEGGYIPAESDAGDIHDFLIDLWGELLTRDCLDRLEEQLRKEAVDREEWSPRAYCEEEDEEARARQADYEDYCDDLAAGRL